MKPLSAKWVIEMAEYFTTHPKIILNGFSAAGISSFLIYSYKFNKTSWTSKYVDMIIIHLMLLYINDNYVINMSHYFVHTHSGNSVRYRCPCSKHLTK